MGMRLRARSWTAGERDETELGSPRFEEEAASQRLGLLSEQQTYLNESMSHNTGLRAIFFTQGKTFFLLLASWILFILYIRLPRASDPVPVVESHHGSPSDGVPISNATLDPANLHLLIPASHPDPNLCKAMLTAGVLGYPAPVIINWDQTFDSPDYVEGGSHLAKISGVNDYLKRLDETHDEDLVLMIDGYDAWVQLRPQTLIDRYFAINKKADERLAMQMKGVAKENGIRQEIIFGCQKRCWPWTENDPPCYAVPHSSLPKDIYGPETDTDIGFEPNPYIKFRPRFINSGVSMGSVRAMKKLFAQALELLEFEKNMGSDQYIFSHILGDQEVWREAVRRDHQKGHEKVLESLKGFNGPKIKFNPKHIEEVRAKAAAREDKNFEFHIGLDYASELGLNTVFAEDDTEWLTWSDGQELLRAEQKLNITSEQSHLHNLSADITGTLPPFWTFNNEPSLPRSTAWTDVPLFTNVWTGIVPAVIHHNAHRDGRKALREQWWDKLWLQKHARTLYDAWIYEPIVPIAYSGGRDWWPADRWKGGGRNGPKIDSEEGFERWVRFDDVCNEFTEEVFRDGKGDWILPEDH